MEQKLVIHVEKNHVLKAVLSYPWSGYTVPTYREVAKLVNFILRNKEEVEDDPVWALAHFITGASIDQLPVFEDDNIMEKTNGGIDLQDANAFIERYGDRLPEGTTLMQTCGNSACGLLTFSLAQMANAGRWANR